MCVPCATKWCFWLDNALLLRSASRWEIRKRKSYMYINVNASLPLKMCWQSGHTEAIQPGQAGSQPPCRDCRHVHSPLAPPVQGLMLSPCWPFSHRHDSMSPSNARYFQALQILLSSVSARDLCRKVLCVLQKKSGELWWKATFDSVAGICLINEAHRCSCGSWNGGSMCTEAGHAATCLPASPEMGHRMIPTSSLQPLTMGQILTFLSIWSVNIFT